MNRLCCANCGKENSTEGARFCAFCGGPLTEKTLTAGQETDLLCTALKDLYINYITWSSNYLATRPAGKITIALVTGDRDYKDRPEHDAFAADCEKAAAAVLENLSSPDCKPAAVLELLDFIFFDAYDLCGNEASWLLMACEKFYLPWLDLLPRRELGSLCERYAAFRKKKMKLPAQDELLKKMKKLSKSRS